MAKVNTNIKGKDILTGGSKTIIGTPLIIDTKDDNLSLPVTTSDEIATEIKDNDGEVTYTSLTEVLNVINTVISNATKDGATGYLRYKLVEGGNPDTTTMKDDILYIFYNIPNNVIMFGYKYVEGNKPINEERFKSSGTVKEFIYDDENGIGKIIFEDDVTNIGNEAFNQSSNITSINIPNSVTSIGYFAFNNCSNLTSINIPDSVTYIDRCAFQNCTSLTSINIPDSVTSIGDYAFYNCSSLTSINIPDSVTYIGDSAFKNCSSLTSINIPSSVTSIGKDVFYNCYVQTNNFINKSNLDSESNNYWGAKIYDFMTEDTLCIRDNEIIYVKDKTRTTYHIPNSVTSIGNSAFSGCSSLTSITIPNSVTSIGNFAFNNCSSLTSITIPNSVTRIYANTFKNCTSLSSITIPNSVTSIGDYAFMNNYNLTSIIIPNSVTSIGDYAFYNCSSLTSITIPNSVTSIGGDVLNSCSKLTSINYIGTLEQFKLISDKVLYQIKTNPGLIITCSDGKYNANLEPIS